MENSISIKKARELLGDKSKGLSDEQIKAKIDIMVVLANRCLDIINSSENHGKNTQSISE